MISPIVKQATACLGMSQLDWFSVLGLFVYYTQFDFISKQYILNNAAGNQPSPQTGNAWRAQLICCCYMCCQPSFGVSLTKTTVGKCLVWFLTRIHKHISHTHYSKMFYAVKVWCVDDGFCLTVCQRKECVSNVLFIHCEFRLGLIHAHYKTTNTYKHHTLYAIYIWQG